ncbi:hypothetical protein RF11_00262 [Thelohanellus kitauei]|uniref:ISXO2-like transposase domain-containing protein n=1 Tax=Thelohanellus kitauei TaxID=669202 RepID=A0A0C2MY16_THEKT|nr:hypothetical protein RF11_00262 [Thelohanellus kitauei]
MELIIIRNIIVVWKNLIRNIVIDYILENPDRIGAHLIPRANQELLIIGGIDKAGQIYMEITARRNMQALADIIRSNAEPGSIIQTDGWVEYRELEIYNCP